MRIDWKRVFVAVGAVALIYLLAVWYRDPQAVFETLAPDRWKREGPGGNPRDVYILPILLGAAALAAAWGSRSSK